MRKSTRLVRNILAVYDAATPEQLAEGASWYPSMNRLMREHAATSTLTVEQVAGIYSATSPNTTFAHNLALATRAIADFNAGNVWHVWYCEDNCARTAAGLTCLGHGTGYGCTGKVVAKVSAIMRGHNPDAVLSSTARMKLRCFAANLAGDYNVVTVDRWAYRVAYALTTGGKAPQGAEYRLIADAYVQAAKQRNVNPATMQAVTWCVARGKGD